MSADGTPASEPGDAGSTPAKRKLPATGAVASDAPSPAAPALPRHAGPLITEFEYQEDPFLPRPGEGQPLQTIVPDIDVKAAGAEGQLLVVPVNGRETSPFGMRFHPVLRRWKLHTGLDYGASCGTPIGAAAAGRVAAVGYSTAYGNMVTIDHGTIGGHHVVTRYAHLSSAAVRVGDHVAQGQGIARVGNTGFSTGCHLHFEVKVGGTFANPKGWLEGRMVVNPEITQEIGFEPEPSPSPSPSPSDSPSPAESASPSELVSPSTSPSPQPAAPSSDKEPSAEERPSPSAPERESSKPVEEPTSKKPSEKPSSSKPSPSEQPSEPGSSPSPSPSPSPSMSTAPSSSSKPSQPPAPEQPSQPVKPSGEPQPVAPNPSE